MVLGDYKWFLVVLGGLSCLGGLDVLGGLNGLGGFKGFLVVLGGPRLS